MSIKPPVHLAHWPGEGDLRSFQRKWIMPNKRLGEILRLWHFWWVLPRLFVQQKEIEVVWEVNDKSFWKTRKVIKESRTWELDFSEALCSEHANFLSNEVIQRVRMK